MSQIIDIFSFCLYAPFFCDTKQFLRIFYFVVSVFCCTVQSVADLTTMIRVGSCSSCCKFQEVTSYDTVSITSADSSRSLRGNTARSHCTDSTTDTLFTKFTVWCLVFYTELPCVSSYFCSRFQQTVGGCFHLFNGSHLKFAHFFPPFVL